ncbi:unnamed protein product [Ceratitis capitata]|uniref:Protein MAK10 homolog n=2 Tax=Ceratitis capitata TaxID=7213 RepID=A0A811ULG9_CERCA|nr:unnamed protein product [Ceratitis capitata]
MNPIANAPVFQAATAAAAAAAAWLNTPGKEDSEEFVVPNITESSQWAMEEAGFLDGEIQRTVRSNEDYGEYPRYGWVDITKEFFEACAELNLGELAQDMLFGLFEAMSAIEMMDPKMDVGMGYNKNDALPHTFESAVEAGVLKLDNLSNEELIGTFDALFACIVSWLEGNSMDQVLFTCLYLHQPSSIKDKSLRSFCHAIRNLIVIIKNIIIISSVNEEEDFQLYGNSSFLAAEDCQPTAVPTQLKEAEDDLVRISKTEKQPESTMAVVHRLRFMRHFYQSIFQFDCVMASAPTESSMNEIYKNLNASLELIPQIKRSIEKGIQPIPNSDSPNPIGFSPRIHDRSQPPTFPRNVKIRDRPTSIQFLEDLVHRLKYACKVVRLRDYYSALNFFIEFSKKSGQCVLSRSVLQGLFISNRRLIFGTIPIKDFLWDSVRAFNSPPVLNPKHPLASDPKIQMHLDTFFRYCISLNTFTQFIRICGFNRARQRDKLARFVDSFDSIQVEAARLDSHMTIMANEKAAEGNEAHATALKHSSQFATWVLYNCFRAMLLYLMSGFELELYSVHEFMYIYWYPHELLISFMISALTRTENNLLVQEEYAEHQSKLQGINSKNRKPKLKKNKKQQKPYRQEIVYYHALSNMCGGFYKALGALTKDGRIRQPMPKFDNEEIRFNRRFVPFATLTSPPPVSYGEFKNIREHMMRPPSSEIYAIAAKHFDQAKNVLESIQNPEQEPYHVLRSERSFRVRHESFAYLYYVFRTQIQMITADSFMILLRKCEANVR